MNYVSTRGEAPRLGFEDVLLTGLAGDGGLYVPETYPLIDADQIAALAGCRYQEVAFQVIRPFVAGALDDHDLAAMIEAAYARFTHPAVTPLVQIGAGEWLLELHHGPTLAFKDLAMQLLARLIDHALARRDRRATIICATSGDTGGAAVEAFAGRQRADLFVLLPKGRVSDVQRRMMTSSGASNVHALEIDGTFDDCQSLVKAMFNDHGFRDRLGLAGVNSINWARVMAQTAYYFAAAVALGAPHRAISFTVPTGNFGDILAGYVAKRMGLPIERLVIATNVNDILARTLDSGHHQGSPVTATASPSMDIQISSNFERLLFDAVGRDANEVRVRMDGLRQSSGYTLSTQALAAIRRDFEAGSANEDETLAMIRSTFDTTGQIIDPHTAVGLHVARHHVARHGGGNAPMVVLATAHAAKFPDTIEAATGYRPALPGALADLAEREERCVGLANDIAAVKQHIAAHSRIEQGTIA